VKNSRMRTLSKDKKAFIPEDKPADYDTFILLVESIIQQ
jgi:hypothetical protein